LDSTCQRVIYNGYFVGEPIWPFSPALSQAIWPRLLDMAEMDKSANKPNQAALFALQLAIAISLFGLDIFLGPGIADGIGYTIVLVLCLRNPRRPYLLLWAGLTTLLVIAGGIISPDDGFLHVASANRFLEICTIWVVWFVIRLLGPTASD
jgi:hypothetical protein